MIFGIARALLVMAALAAAAGSHAAATIEAVNGDVRAGLSAAGAVPVKAGQTVTTGNFVVTGPKSGATLRFTDSSAVALYENTEFRIADYAFSEENRSGDRSRFEFFKGAMRAVTAALSSRSPDAYSVRTPQATIGIRGTDFMLSVVNPLFFQVLNGSISVVNSAGAPVFATGAIGTVATDGTLALLVAPGTLPAGVVQAFNQLSALNLASLVPVPGPATPGVVPAGFAGAIVPGAILIGIGIAVAGESDDSSASTTTTTTTGTR